MRAAGVRGTVLKSLRENIQGIASRFYTDSFGRSSLRSFETNPTFYFF